MEHTIKSNLQEGRTENTVKKYMTMIRKVVNGALEGNWGESHDELAEQMHAQRNDICVWIQTNTKESTVAPTFRAMLVLIDSSLKKHCSSTMEEKLNEIHSIIQTFYFRGKRVESESQCYREATDEEVRNRILPQHLIRKFDELKRDLQKREGKQTMQPSYFKDWRKCVIIGMYRFLPPLRGQELYTLRISENGSYPEEGNWIDMHQWEIVCRDHKTARSHGTHTVEIQNPELRNIIKKYIEHTGLQGGELFLPKNLTTQRDTPNNSRWFSDTLNHTIGCSVHQLRQSYVSGLLDDLEKRKVHGEISQQYVNEKRKEIAKIMGHTVGTQETIYTKFRGL